MAKTIKKLVELLNAHAHKESANLQCNKPADRGPQMYVRNARSTSSVSLQVYATPLR